MKLYYFPTPSSRKPCAVARHQGLKLDYQLVDLAKGDTRRPGFLAVNPNGKVPALEDGDVKLWESNAIMCHLAQKGGGGLWPRDGAAQTDIIRWLCWDTAHFSRHGGRLLFERYIKPNFGLGETNPAEVEDATGYFKQFATVLNGHLKGRGYLVGKDLTIADFAVATFLPTAKEAALPLDGFAEIERWHDKLMQLPAWREPFPA